MDLPYAIDDEPSSPGSGSGESLVPAVLIVDDEQTVLDLFTRLLDREDDLSVATALTAEAALELLSSRRFDLLITDKNLPGMGGVELISVARKHRPVLEAIMITGYANGESVLAALAAGASDYLKKPFEDLKVVRAKIRAALDRRAEHTKDREASKRIAREASELLSKGKVVPGPLWEALERELQACDAANREAGRGLVRVVGPDEVLAVLLGQRLDATLAEADEPGLDDADVVVLDTAQPGWRELADRLASLPPDVVLVARPDADLADLLDALSLHMDLVGFGTHRFETHGALVDKVRALLMRRNIERTQAALSKALEAFRAALEQIPG